MDKINAALNCFLETHAETFVLQRRQRLMEIEKVINPILSEVKKIYERFDFETLSGKTFYVVKSPNHYEILLVFQGIDPEELAIEAVSYTHLTLPTSDLV